MASARLENRFAIDRALAKYTRGLDARNLTMFRDAFTEDGELIVDGSCYVGRRALTDGVSAV